MLSMLLQVLINGILLGGIYAIMSIGLNLIFGVVKVINFAHGEFLMIGMYITYWMSILYGVDPYLSIPIAASVVATLGMFTQVLMINPLLKAGETSQILATAGLMVFLENLALFLWGSSFKSVLTSYSALGLNLAGIMISFTRIVGFVIAIVTTVLFYLFLIRTELGMKIRAVVQDNELAELMGVDHKKIYVISFGLGGALVGMAAAIMSPIYYVFPTVGFLFGPTSFIVVVLGGLGSFTGAVVGGLIIGIVEATIGVLANVELAKAFAFAIFLLFLFWRPGGLFGEKVRA